MSTRVLLRYLNPWKFRREQEERRLAALRSRDGDACRRCRRPLRFDLPKGHDQSPKVEHVLDGIHLAEDGYHNLCLCHVRCNSSGADHTGEVTERIRRKQEADLLSRSGKRGKAA